MNLAPIAASLAPKATAYCTLSVQLPAAGALTLIKRQPTLWRRTDPNGWWIKSPRAESGTLLRFRPGKHGLRTQGCPDRARRPGDMTT